jgi:hypothetical protein
MTDAQIREMIKNILLTTEEEEEVEEANTTGSVGGSYNTPNAFSKDKKSSRVKKNLKKMSKKGGAIEGYDLVEKQLRKFIRNELNKDNG